MRVTPVVLLLIAGPAAAQQLPPAPPRYVASFRQGPDSQTPSPKATFGWEGAKVGGAIGFLAGVGGGYGWCAQGDSGHPTNFGYCAPRALIGGLIGATLGSIVGGFIGSTVPRAPDAPLSP